MDRLHESMLLIAMKIDDIIALLNRTVDIFTVIDSLQG